VKISWLPSAPSNAIRLLVFVVFSIVLMVVDHRSHYLQAIRSTLSVVVYPLQVAAQLPEDIGSGIVDYFTSTSTLRGENAQLRRDNLLLHGRLEKLASLEAENARLRRLLGAAARVADKAMIAELVEVSLDPYAQKIMINRGSRDGVFIGQAVIDADGVMGQVIQVTPFTSVVILITDPSHAIPVQVQRNGLRSILFGTGSRERLELRHLTNLSDIREGDLLVTSGMGGRFPVGYPVARVSRITSNPDEAFLQIQARPVAHLDHSKEVLLIWSPKKSKTGGKPND
jgi:rod shape-determining protein MreC